MRPLLLDTCAALWVGEPDKLSEPAKQAIADTLKARQPVYVSPITAWEVGLLVSRGRLPLLTDPERWFTALLEVEFTLSPLTPAIFVASSFLPQSALRDPADKIMAATARVCDFRLMTRDRPLLDYARAGWMQAVRC